MLLGMIAPETLVILSQMTNKDLTEGDVYSLLSEMNSLDSYSPGAVISNVVEGLQMRYGALAKGEQVESIFSDILARDRHTGYFIHGALRSIYLDFAMVHSGLSNQKDRNFLMLGDFMNLSSVNEAIGRNTTNDMMATICGIYLHSMTRAGVVNWLYHRSMGDEITFVIADTDREKLEDGLREAESITEEFVQSLGLERLRHKKYPDQHGTGLVTSFMPLTENTDHRTLKLQLDENIKEKKRSRRTLGQKFAWLGLNRKGVDPDQFHNRSSEQRVDKALHKSKYFRTMAQIYGDANNKVGPRNPLNPAKTLLIGRAIAWPRDDRIEYLRFHHDNSKIMLRSDIYNLGGLNAVFGHDGADHLKAHMIRILYSTITSHDNNEPKIFDCGGGIIDLVINAMPNPQLHKLIETLQNNIHHQILSYKVADYCQEHNLTFSGNGNILIADLSHPKHEAEGTGMVMATHLVEKTRSLPEIIERLDKITHRTKMHYFSYLWEDEDKNVFAFPLNRFTDPIHIGKDREERNNHYLPFTDALRHYMKYEDLPLIFEKPVGQISETLFGTDMQAVLGFKKAVLMLQEKGISDEEILEIKSYEAMDKRLRQEALPPLSVVSTQNRPAYVTNEREYFRTMTLAEKLEDLPASMTSLILQAQAVFRTLKVIQPHGHLPGNQAIQVLEEELQRFKIPGADIVHPDEQLTESLHGLARMVDLVCAALDKNMSNSMRQALRDFSFEILRDLSDSFHKVGEVFLAEKFQEYIAANHPAKTDRIENMNQLKQELQQLFQILLKKKPLEQSALEGLQQSLLKLLKIIHNYSKAHPGDSRKTA